jgi:hypothetical protein
LVLADAYGFGRAGGGLVGALRFGPLWGLKLWAALAAFLAASDLPFALPLRRSSRHHLGGLHGEHGALGITISDAIGKNRSISFVTESGLPVVYPQR